MKHKEISIQMPLMIVDFLFLFSSSSFAVTNQQAIEFEIATNNNKAANNNKVTNAKETDILTSGCAA
jgi:hypothetical protein